MRRTTKRAALCAVVLVMTGCASTFPAIGDLKPAPPDRIFIKDGPPDAATVTLLRTKEVHGFAVNFRVLANGQPAASIGWSEWLSFPVPPGEMILEVRHPLPILGVSGDSAVFTATPREKYYFRVVSGDDGPRLLRTTANSANGQ